MPKKVTTIYIRPELTEIADQKARQLGIKSRSLYIEYLIEQDNQIVHNPRQVAIKAQQEIDSLQAERKHIDTRIKELQPKAALLHQTKLDDPLPTGRLSILDTRMGSNEDCLTYYEWYKAHRGRGRSNDQIFETVSKGNMNRDLKTLDISPEDFIDKCRQRQESENTGGLYQ